MTAPSIPLPLAALAGRIPAALRAVSWTDSTTYLEIETKDGRVLIIDARDGTVHADPPSPPGTGNRARRWRDLTTALPEAFDARPTFSGVTGDGSGYTLRLSTGARLEMRFGARLHVESAG